MAVESETNRGVSGGGGPALEPIWDRPYRPPWMRVVNGTGRILRGMGLGRGRIAPDALMAIAERRTGLSGWGDDGFREGLAALVDAFEARDVAHAFGRYFFREYVIRLLSNRLRIEDEIRRRPEIADVPVRRPLIVTGLPRSGTTHLHRLLAEEPRGRPLLFWETLEPSPAPAPDTRRTDPRIARARKAVATIHALAPGIAAAHHFDAEAPEECNNLYAHRFIAGINGFLFDVPDYVQWLDGQDVVPAYREARRQLQLLGSRIPADPWILKAPAHLFSLDALLAVFPDAMIVQTHRDPTAVIPSVCSLASAFRGIVSDRVDLRRLGAEFNDVLARGTERAIAVREAADPARFFDLAYSDLLEDPFASVRAIYEHFNLPFTPEFETRLRRYQEASPQHKHGVHRYRLERFGLDAEAVRSRFAPYLDWAREHARPRFGA